MAAQKSKQTSNNKHDWTAVIYINISHHNRTQKAVATIFYHIAKILPTSYFGHFAHVWPLPSKMKMPTCRIFDVYLHAKNELQP